MRERPDILTTFTPQNAASLPGGAWLHQRRAAAAERFASAPLPTDKDEVWRYSRIDQLDLDRYRFGPTDGSGATPSALVRALVDGLGPRAGLVMTVAGTPTTAAAVGPVPGLTVTGLAGHPEAETLFGGTATDPSDFVLLNEAFAPDPVIIDIAPGTVVGDPVVVVHVVGASESALFPRTIVRCGASSRASVVEIVVDPAGGLLGLDAPSGTPATGTAAAPPRHLVVPVTELQVESGADLSVVSIQATGPETWYLAHQASRIAAGAVLTSFTVALGGSYARVRTDSALTGVSAASTLRAAYFGQGDQMLDFRTLQDHQAPRTTSDLLFMGAVAEQAHSVYSGLIRIRRGAVRSDARQTNHNLVLGEGARADSVPNLDIEENDVRCAHGSTVGPVDEDQRYYLESRGIEPEMAETLIVAGFFEDIADQVPVPGARRLISRALAARTGADRG